MHPHKLLLLGLLIGCGDKETDTSAPGTDTDTSDVDTDPDEDGDGSPASLDCDDGDASVSPDTEELCDGIDNNCDGAVDEGFDADGDGVLACDGDCDDDSDATHPGAEEICDGADNDCDDEIDEEPIDGAIFYADADADGYGDEAAVTVACAQPAGTVDGTLGFDCDDTEETTHPGAEEVCLDGVDNNCDDSAAGCELDAELDMDAADVVIHGAEGEQLANTTVSLATGADVNGDGSDDVLIGVNRYGTGEGTKLFYGASLTGELDAADADALFTSDSGELIGTTVAMGGDTDEDGTPDIFISDPGGTNEVFVFAGPVSGAVSLESDADAIISSTDAFGSLGYAMDADGDLDGDGVDDLLVSSLGYSSYAGGVFVFSGVLSGDVSVEEDASWTLIGDAFSFSGSGAAQVGDLDGDGASEVMVGAIHANSYQGGVYLFSGPLSGTSSFSDADASISGTQMFSLFGSQPIIADGDLDGDGYGDIVASQLSATTGQTHIFFGMPAAGASASDADITLTGPGNASYFGTRVSVGDVNGDQQDDLFIIASGADFSTAPGGYLYYGPLSGGLSLKDADVVLYPDAGAEIESGSSIAGDLNGDGSDDLIVSDGSWSGNGASSGAVSIFFGPGL